MPQTIDPQANLIIRDTIDGRPEDEGLYPTLDDAAAAASAADVSVRKRVARKASAAAPAADTLKSDPYIWGIYVMLLVASTIELFSASSSIVSSTNVYSPLIGHGIFLLLGLGLAFVLQRVKYVFFRRWSVILAVVSLIMLVYATYAGEEINGAQRAFKLLGFTIQPAEIVKLTIVLFLAKVLATNQEPGGVSNKGVIIAASTVILFAGITWKNGLTNTVLLMGVSMAMFLIGGMQWRKFGIVVLVYCMCGGALFMLKYDDNAADKKAFNQTEQMASGVPQSGVQEVGGKDRADTHKGRLSRFIEGVHPDDPITDLNRQVIFANFAQARGGLVGHGPGNSQESARLPLAFSDYIFSIIIEDTGFVGGVALLVIYLCLLGRAGHIASKCSRAFPALLVMGCAVLIVLQALAHMAIVVGIVPVSGQPLPFISKGGTSVLVMSAAIGMMLSVSRYGVTRGDKKQMRAEEKELPEDMLAVNPTALQ